jgi:hypothetical protein
VGSVPRGSGGPATWSGPPTATRSARHGPRRASSHRSVHMRADRPGRPPVPAGPVDGHLHRPVHVRPTPSCRVHPVSSATTATPTPATTPPRGSTPRDTTRSTADCSAGSPPAWRPWDASWADASPGHTPRCFKACLGQPCPGERQRLRPAVLRDLAVVGCGGRGGVCSVGFDMASACTEAADHRRGYYAAGSCRVRPMSRVGSGACRRRGATCGAGRPHGNGCVRAVAGALCRGSLLGGVHGQAPMGAIGESRPVPAAVSRT